MPSVFIQGCEPDATPAANATKPLLNCGRLRPNSGWPDLPTLLRRCEPHLQRHLASHAFVDNFSCKPRRNSLRNGTAEDATERVPPNFRPRTLSTSFFRRGRRQFLEAWIVPERI